MMKLGPDFTARAYGSRDGSTSWWIRSTATTIQTFPYFTYDKVKVSPLNPVRLTVPVKSW